MKHGKIGWAAALVVGGAFLAAPVLAMNGHDMSGGMDHGQMQQMGSMEHDQGGMNGMIMLGEEVEDGVKAMFHLMPIDPQVLPAGHEATHHLMVMFNDIDTGKSLDTGTVAVKISSPEEKEAAPVKMMGMQGHFGLDVNLNQPGTWQFRVATKLADGKVRQYHSQYVVE
jgi:hypothetical protein